MHLKIFIDTRREGAYMKKSIKNFGVALAATLSLGLGTAAVATLNQPVQALAETQDSYYYSQLTTDAKKFYNAIDKMAEDGTFKTGNGEYDLIANNVVTATQLANVSSDSDVMIAFGAARDAYTLDHPELFYVATDYLSLNVGTKGSSYVATLGAGRGDNYYLEEGDLKSSEKIDAAINKFNNSVNEIVNNAKKSTDEVEQIKSVNKQIIDKVTYTFDGTLVHNPYGALVNGQAVCEGYAKAFKVVMDKLGIECLLVQGYADSAGDGNYQAHMWNYVKLDDRWYAIDSTWNDGENLPEDGYLLLGSLSFNEDHAADGVISAVQYEFTYPSLYVYDYGELSDFTYALSDAAEGNNLLDLKVGYKGKNIEKLNQENLYLAFRTKDSGGTWTAWGEIVSDFYNINNSSSSYSVIESFGTYFKYIQFAVFNVQSDMENFCYYTDAQAGNIVATSPEIQNDDYGKYVPPPFVQSVSPSNSSNLDPETTYDMVFTFSEDMVKAEGKDVTITITNKSGETISGAKVSKVVWSESQPNKVSFTLEPSKQYGDTDYIITVNGLVGKETGIAPDGASYRFWRKSIVCSKVYDDGRLWMNVYGSPSLVSDGDLTMDGWTDDQGKALASQRSQLMLVASKPDSSTEDTMLDMAGQNEKVLQSSTYEIDLLLCGCVQKVPEGSFMQVGFGFPADYSPDTEGVTYKVYHYKTDENGNITGMEEVECVITEYGIIAKVDSFSPYAVVAVKKTENANAAKGIYARTASTGGTFNSGIAKVESGSSITYTFTPEDKYQVDRVLLNGSAVEVTNNTLTLTYDQLSDNNTVEAYFVAKSVAEKQAADGITPIYPKTKIVGVTKANPGDLSIADTTIATSSGWETVIVTLSIILAVAAVGVATFFVVRDIKSEKVAESEEEDDSKKSKK
jgi:hypothetical protein